MRSVYVCMKMENENGLFVIGVTGTRYEADKESPRRRRVDILFDFLSGPTGFGKRGTGNVKRASLTLTLTV